MVFCDSCNICVHQACYGITAIPSGSWLCRTCAQGQRPECVLCPNKGGAMKCTRSGQKWAHVSCALWIPEVSVGCVEKMEPITKISSIPVRIRFRYSLNELEEFVLPFVLLHQHCLFLYSKVGGHSYASCAENVLALASNVLLKRVKSPTTLHARSNMGSK